MWKKRLLAGIILLIGAGVAFFVYKTEPRMNPNYPSQSSFWKSFPFRLGLDLSGGSHLVYKADVSQIPTGQVADSMSALRDVIERRVNLFGVSEPVVQVQGSGLLSGNADNQLIVDLPGVTDVDKAAEMIGQTPLLQFKTQSTKKPVLTPDKNGVLSLDINSGFEDTPLTGRYLDRATLEFNPTTNQPVVGLKFNAEGTKLFADITKANVGKIVAIFLDGSPISLPTVKEPITDGTAQISGSFTPAEAKTLVGRLNSGALPVPITLVSRQTIGAILGQNAVTAGTRAAVIGFLAVALFLILWYRLPGLIAVIALLIYVSIILALFKLIPVTLTAAGMAGFIISLGIAVDANILIFERVKEEMRSGKTIAEAISAGFSRAWFSIRDSNISSILSAVILYWFGTSLIKGFALTLGMGVLISMLSAITISKIFFQAMSFEKNGKVARFLFGSGLSK